MIRSIIARTTGTTSRALTRFIFTMKGVECIDQSQINGVVKVHGRGQLKIGHGVRINSGANNNPIGGDTRMRFTLRGGQIEIEDDVSMSNCTLVSDTRILICAHAMLGGGVKIYDTDFHSINPIERRSETQGKYHGISRTVVVGPNSFIGAHSIILKGVEIGENSVVGAGSVVTKSIPQNEIWAGNPAKFVRRINMGNPASKTERGTV